MVPEGMELGMPMSYREVADTSFVMTEMPNKTAASTSADPQRPDYGSTRRPRLALLRRRPVLFGLVVLLVAGGALSWWAEGRGYKTAVLRRLFPNDPSYLKKPTV